MLNQLDPTLYNVSLYSTLIVIAVKFIIAAYIGRRDALKPRAEKQHRFTFMSAACLLLLCLGISRLIYFYYDFFLTEFNPNLLWVKPNVYYWQAATLISGISAAFLLFVLERDIYRFKTKLIPTGAVIVVAAIQFLYPINSEADFTFVSTIGIVGSLAFLLAIITFVYLAIKSTGHLRRVCVVLMIGMLLYALAGITMSENILSALDAMIAGARTFVIVANPVIKIVAFIIIGWGAVNFGL
jgi:hypothetical protein